MREVREIMRELYATGLTLEQQVLVGELIMSSSRYAAPKSGAQRTQEWRDRTADVTLVTKTSLPSLCTNIEDNNTTSLPPEIAKTLSLPPKPKAQRLPGDWHPPEDLWQRAKQKLSFDDEKLKFETNSFRDHFWGMSGARASKLDWPATWMNWMRESYRRAQKFKPQQAPKISIVNGAYKPFAPEPDLPPPTPEEIERRNKAVALLKQATRGISR